MDTATGVTLIDPDVFLDGPPYVTFDAIRTNHGIYGEPHPRGGTIWHLTRYEDVREASKNVDLFSSSSLIVYTTRPEDMMAQTRENMLFMDPPNHTRMRSFAAKAFSPAVVGRFEEWIRDLCVGIADRVAATEGEFDAVNYISAALPAQVIGSILGVPEADRPHVVELIMRQMGEFDPEIGPEGMGKAVADLLDYSLSLRALKLREPGVDMATQLAVREGEDSLTDDEYRHMVQTLASAGFETTHTLIAQSLYMGAKDAEIRDALDTTDRRALSPVIDELLRLITPTMYFGRTVTRDTEFQGVKMAEGDFVMLWFAAANRDPAKYDKPDQFVIQRPGRNHIAFGAGGPHFCIGNHLAKLEVELLYQEFSKRGLRFELAGEPTRLPGTFINGLRKLPMRVVR